MTEQLRLSRPAVERLEDRLTPATTAYFAFGVLTVVGDGAANDIVVAAVDGNLRVTDGGAAVAIRSFGSPTLARTAAVVVLGQGGDDALTIDASMGNVAAVLSGGAGNDELVAEHAGNSWLSGDAGNDTLTGGGGNDVLFGGAGNDALDGGGGADLVAGGLGDDTLDGGGADGARDVLVGGPGADTFTAFAAETDLFLDLDEDEGDTVVNG